MKKYLILLFSLISVFGYTQTLHPNSGTTALTVNNANTLPTTVSGTNTYTATLPSAGTITDATNFFTDITDRLIYYKFTNAATSAPFTLNLNSEGAKDLKKRDATGSIVDIVATDIAAGQVLPIRYNGTYLVIEGSGGGITTPVSIANGGTNASSQSTNGINYFDGTSITSDATKFFWDGSRFRIQNAGVSATSPQTGTLLHLVSQSNTFNSRLSNDSYVNTQTMGSVFQGRTARGTIASPSASQTDDIIAAWNGVGYKSTGFGTGGNAAMTFNAGSNMTDTNAETYIRFLTTPNASTTLTERFRIGSSGQFGIGGATYGSSNALFTSGGSSSAPSWTSTGTGVLTWLGTPSWTNFNSAITGTAPFYSLANGGTLTGANTITGTTTNTLKAVFNSLGGSSTTVTNGAGLWLANTTAATLGNQQTSPWLVFEGNGWATGTGTTRSARLAITLLPVQGSVIGFQMPFMFSDNGGAYVSAFSITGSGPSAGTYSFTSGASIGSITNTMTIQAQNAAANGVQINQGYSSNVTNGNAWRFSQGFSSTSGTVTWNSTVWDGAINQTGGSSGATRLIKITPTYTSVGGDVYGVDYDPTVTLVAGTNIAWRNTTGVMLIGGSTPTASTRVDQRGIGSTSSTINHRWANSSNTVLAQLTDDGALALNSKIVGRAVLVGGTVTVNTTAIQSGDEIFLTNRITGGTPGLLSVGTVTAGTSFVINSASGTDTSTISWMIIKTAP